MTLDLTPNTDSATGGAADDTIDGSRDIVGGSRFDTVDNTDSINGGAGTDTLNVELSGGVTITPASLAGVEVINISALAANSFLNASNSDALTTVGFNNLSAGAQVSNVQTLLSDVDATNNNGNSVTLTYLNTAAAGTADVLDVDLNNFTSAALSISAAGGAGGYETITVSSLGSANTISTLTVDAETTKMSIDGAQNLTITNAIAQNVLTFDASGATGKVDIETGDADDIVTFTGGSGNDTFDIAGAVGALTTADVLDGGAGSDTLKVGEEDIDDLTALTAFSKITNFETLQIETAIDASASVRLDRIQAGLTNVDVEVATAGAATFGSEMTGLNIEFKINPVGAITIDHTSGTSITDSITIDLDYGAAATLGGVLTVTDYETVTIAIPDGTITSGGAVTLTPTVGASSTLAITGDSSLTMAATHAITADVIDASGMVMAAITSAGLVMSTATVAASGANITGSNGADTLMGSTAADIIIGGTGADIVNGAAGADRITLGAGDDVVRITSIGTSDTVTDFSIGTSSDPTDQIEFSESGIGTQLTTGNGTDVTAATAIDFASGANGDALSLTVTDSIIKVTNTSGINSNADLVYNVTLTANSGTDGDGMLVLWYDADDGAAVVSIVVDTDSDADNIINASNDTTTDIVTLSGISATDFDNMLAANFDFIT
jgi:hypothetical protein